MFPVGSGAGAAEQNVRCSQMTNTQSVSTFSYGKLFLYAVALYGASAVLFLVGGSVPWHAVRVFSLAIGWLLQAMALLCGIASVVRAVQSIRAKSCASAQSKGQSQ